MFTISLMIGCYDDEVFAREFPKYVLKKGWGKVKKANFLNEVDGYYRYAVDILAKDAEGLMFELEMLACGHEEVPSELATVNFTTISYRVVAIPADYEHKDSVGFINQTLNTLAMVRSSQINTLERLQALEQKLRQLPEPGDNSTAINQMADVINTLSEKVIGHKMIEIDNRNNYEVKPKWLH